MQSWCNHKILVQLKNTRAGVYRTRRKSSARLFSNCPGIPGLHRAITIPQHNNRASFYILSSTEGGASRQSRSHRSVITIRKSIPPQYQPTLGAFPHPFQSYRNYKCSTTRNLQSACNPGAITKSKCNQRTYGPEYIEPGFQDRAFTTLVVVPTQRRETKQIPTKYNRLFHDTGTVNSTQNISSSAILQS